MRSLPKEDNNNDCNSASNNKLSHREEGIVIKLDRGYPLVLLGDGTKLRCEHATSLVKKKTDRAVIGDRVVVDRPEGHEKAIIEKILPRMTSFVRKDPTERALPQTLAANFDIVLIAQPVEEVNLKRLERELVLAHETGADVAIVLTKADLVQEYVQLKKTYETVRALAGDDRVLVVSQNDPDSIETLASLIASNDSTREEQAGAYKENTDDLTQKTKNGGTAILIGRSGVGKSSLVNMLVGKEIQRTTPVRQNDGKGRHTTVSREIIPLPHGGAIVDMPGVRGLGLWEAGEGIRAAFSEIEKLAQQCKFRDCTHQHESGCAVRAAVKAGELAPERLDSYLRLCGENDEIQVKRVEAQRIRDRRGHPRHRSSFRAKN